MCASSGRVHALIGRCYVSSLNNNISDPDVNLTSTIIKEMSFYSCPFYLHCIHIIMGSSLKDKLLYFSAQNDIVVNLGYINTKHKLIYCPILVFFTTPTPKNSMPRNPILYYVFPHSFLDP